MVRPRSQLPSLPSPFTPAPVRRLWTPPYIPASDPSSSVPGSPLMTGTVPSSPSAASAASAPTMSGDDSDDDDDHSDDDDGTGKVRWNPEVLLFARRLEKAERKYRSLAIANLDQPVSNTFASSAKPV